MAVSALRLRRTALSLSTFIFNHHSTPLCSSAPALISRSSSQNPNLDFPNFPSQSRAFRSSNIWFARPRTSFDDEKPIGEDDILFAGCDYNHWLIVMDFPRDNKPSPEQMVETYVQTAAKVLGSVEEAKRKIYACSTTTYQGFQVEVSEELSRKFEGLPGVVFVLPDSYIDPANKEYGGDKYINGTIIPRPPPVQYHQYGKGRYGDRNREFNRQSRERGEYQQGSQTYDNRGSMQGSPRNFAGPQNPPPQQNYGPPRVNEIGVSNPKNDFSGGQDSFPGYRRDQVPPYQGNYNQDRLGSSYPQGQTVPPGQLNNNAPSRVAVSWESAGVNYGQDAGGGQRQGVGGSQVQGAGWGQGVGGGYGQGAGGGYGQGAGGRYGQGPPGGGYGAQGGGYGVPVGGYASVGEGYGAGGNYGQGTGGGVPDHNKTSNYSQSYSIHGENERSQGDQMNDVRQVQQ